MEIEKITARYEIVTPSFIAGMSSDEQDVTVRLASLRGLLRFWWRAVAFSRVGYNLETLRTKETALFGSSRGGTGSIQFLPPTILPSPSSRFTETARKLRLDQCSGLSYLGYGLQADDKGRQEQSELAKDTGKKSGIDPKRVVIPPKVEFDLHMMLRRRLTDDTLDQKASLRDALIAMGLAGGLGARSRRGWGSLNLKSLTWGGEALWKPPAEASDLRSKWKQLLAGISTLPDSDDYLPFTAFDHRTEVHVLKVHSDALEVLNQGGKDFSNFRLAGRNGASSGTKHRFAADSQMMGNALNRKAPAKAPQRSIFGLPHNYFFGKTKPKASVTVDTGRRASPLFFHVQRLGTQYALVAVVFPVKFIWDSTSGPRQLQVTVDNQLCSKVPATIEDDYSVIREFFKAAVNDCEGNSDSATGRMWP